MGRHGSRWPLSSELGYIVNLTEKLAASYDYVCVRLSYSQLMY